MKNLLLCYLYLTSFLTCSANWCAKLYQHGHYKGWVHEVKATHYGATHKTKYANLPGNKNDQVSSVVVRDSCVFKAYRHYDGKSLMATIKGKKAFVGKDNNDKLSSYDCRCVNYVWEDTQAESLGGGKVYGVHVKANHKIGVKDDVGFVQHTADAYQGIDGSGKWGVGTMAHASINDGDWGKGFPGFRGGIEANLKTTVGDGTKDRVGLEYGVGLGADVGYNPLTKNAGASVALPVGTFGGHFGCTTKICIFGCITMNFC